MHIQCCKYILGVNRKCSNLAAIAEIGRYPKLIQIVINILKYWIRIRNMDEESLVYKSFVENIKLLNNGHYCWLKTIQDIFNTLDICKKDNTPILDPENIPISQKEFIEICKTSLERRFDEQLKFDLFDDRDTQKGNKLRTFRQFKCKIRQENYLCTIHNVNLRKNITKLRLSAHNLPIETGRYKRPVKIPPNLRLCEECNMNLVGDEFHIIMKCDKYRILRKDFF